ncbi:HAD family hydrolase [Fonticella tunisiensis]|uniref:Beta-phosphoglucomutase n=1 Tax=Fonticella tunisiensis TaxID=1096341 RepID=A0A4R7K9E6_9CLOT|nr:HAD family phosphatase [Fonticella tunisiensis]TDT50372.1 HAD superfamily hydrolase (TIGR01509 family)/HAD superfamily hydrolase (TIGR01549 family)/beta-phosphoglucomutase family hydrolase [Fonticella tunisiensis]
MLKAVIFDMDGVIVDSEPVHEKVCKRRFKELNINVTDEEYDAFVGTTNTEMWTIIKSKYNLNETVEELVSMHLEEVMEYLRESDETPIPGIKDLLGSIKREGIKIALASSSPMENIELVLEKFGIGDYFESVISGENLERSKPAPDIFLKSAEKLGVNPENCVVIEDSHNGVKAAKAAGMKCVGFKNINSGNQDLSMADIIVYSIEDVNIERLKALFE